MGKNSPRKAAKQIAWCQKMLPRTLWPSGLRQWLKAPFRKGVGSNPTAVTLALVYEHTVYGLQSHARCGGPGQLEGVLVKLCLSVFKAPGPKIVH